MKNIVAAATLALTVAMPTMSDAAVVINASEIGGDVVFTYSGSIDLAGLGAPVFTFNNGSRISPSDGAVLMGNNATMDFWAGPYTFAPFGPGLCCDSPNDVTGPGFSIFSDGLGIFNGYVSGAALAGGMTFDNSTFASLEMTPGTYSVILPNDTVTLIIGIASVPEPGALVLLGLGLAGLALRRRTG